MFQMFSRNTFGLFVLSISLFLSDAIFQNSETLFKNIGIRKIVYPKVLTYKEATTRFNKWNNENKHIDRGSLYIAVNRWTIKTNFNDDLLISPNYVSQWVRSAKEDKPTNDYDKQKLHKCVPLKGNVQEVKESSVLLTLCDNDIFGLINVSRKSFFLQPTDIARRHILYETIVSYKLTSMLDKYRSFSKKNEGQEQNERDPIINNIVENDEKEKSEGEDQCMALVVGTNETRYIAVESSHCQKQYRKNDKNDNVRTTINFDRDRRQLGRFNRSDYYYRAERPYHETYDCFERRRNKRALAICDTAEYYNLTLDLATSDYIHYVDEVSETRFDSNYDISDEMNDRNQPIHQKLEEEHSNAEIGMRQKFTFTSHSRIHYRWAKMIVGVDYDVIHFHGRRTEHYVFTVFNIVSSLFKEMSSTDILRIVIMKMILYPDPQDSAIYTGDTRYPLFSVNKWNREIWRSAEEKHDMAVWYTHFRVNDEVNTSPGPYMCQWQWSCLLIEDVGWLSAIRVAHGIGHLMGLTHDGDLAVNNNCALDALLQTTIMSSVIPAVMPNPVWSPCSKHEFIDSIKKYPCLDKPPLSYEHTEFLYGVFSLDEQCRIEFGDGWVYCNRISVRDPCKELWCNKNIGKRRSCMTRQTRTLEGTLCGRGKRCINQTCENAKRPGYIEMTTSQRPPGHTDSNTTLSPPDYPGTTTYKPPSNTESSTYPPSNYPASSTHGPPSHPGSSTYGPPIHSEPTTYKPPGYPQNSTYGPTGYPGSSTYGPPGYTETSTHKPSGYPGSDTYRPPGYHESSTYGPPSYHGSSTYGPPSYPETSTYGPPGYPETSTYGPPGYPETSTYGPPGYPETSTYGPPGYPETSTYGPPGYPETSTYGPPGYPETSTYGPPDYPETSTYGPPGYPGSSTYGPPGYPQTSTYGPPGYPQTSTYKPHGYPQPTSTNKSPGYHPPTSTYKPHGYPQPASTNKPPGYYPPTSTHRPHGYPQPASINKPPGYHPPTSIHRPPGYHPPTGAHKPHGPQENGSFRSPGSPGYTESSRQPGFYGSSIYGPQSGNHGAPTPSAPSGDFPQSSLPSHNQGPGRFRFPYNPQYV